MKREKWADILKGIGAVIVVIGHLVLYDGNAKIYIYSFHMPLFFFISGYLYHQEKSFFQFLLRKVRTLIIPYFMFAFLSIVITYFFETPQMTKGEILKNLFFINGSFIFNSSLWFLITMFFSLIIFYILNKIFKIHNNVKSIVMCLLLLIICVFLNIKKYKFYFGLEIVPNALLIFILGYLYKLNKNKINEKLEKVIGNNLLFICSIIILFILTVALSLYNGRVNMSTSIYNNYFIYLSVVIMSLYLYIMIAKKLDLSKIMINKRISAILIEFSFLSLIMFCTQRLLFKVYFKIQNIIGIDFMSGENPIYTIAIILITLIIYYLYGKIKNKIRRSIQ